MINLNCVACGQTLTSRDQKLYCSHSCRAQHVNTTRYVTRKHVYVRAGTTCQSCGSVFCALTARRKTCSDACANIIKRQNRSDPFIREQLSKAGRKSAAVRKSTKRSRDEIALFDLCKRLDHSVISNAIIAEGWDADIVFSTVKVCVFWNGPWHYREMGVKNHSLKQVQRRDKIKTQLFESLGWTVLSFEDRTFTPQSAFNAITSVIAKMRGLESNQSSGL